MFCARWVDEDLISYEDFIVLYELEKTDAKSMIAMIKGILRFGLDGEKNMRSVPRWLQSHDEKIEGVVTQTKKEVQTLALFAHCYVHSLNLACGDWIRNSTVVSKLLNTSYEITC